MESVLIKYLNIFLLINLGSNLVKLIQLLKAPSNLKLRQSSRCFSLKILHVIPKKKIKNFLFSKNPTEKAQKHFFGSNDQAKAINIINYTKKA